MSEQRSRVSVSRDVPIAMRDGTRLYADLYRPEVDRRYPVLLQRTPYNKTVETWPKTNFRPSPAFLASCGYAVIIQDVRGRFKSEGEYDPYKRDAEDGYDTVQWAAAQPWSSGKVGMFGGSYMGATQFLAASAKPPALQALFPYFTGSSHYDTWVYAGGAFNLLTRFTWVVRMMVDTAARKGSGMPKPLKELAEAMAELRKSASAEAGSDVAELERGIVALLSRLLNPVPLRELPIPEELGGYFFDWLDHWKDDGYWQRINTENEYGRIRLPMLHIGGWYDEFARSTLDNYVGFSRHLASEAGRVSQKLIMGPWIHGSFSRNIGDVDFGPEIDESERYINDLNAAYFDYWLKGIDNGYAETPPVRLFIMGVNRWRDEREWPLARTDYQSWYVHSDGTANEARGGGWLSPEPPVDEPPDQYAYDPDHPVQTNGGNILRIGMNIGPCDQRRDTPRDDVLSYVSKPLEADMEVTGYIKMKLWAATDAEDTDFTAKLIDVYPDGTEINIQDGVIRASFRESLADPHPVEPGRVYAYEIDLWATSQLFFKGHRIKLELSSSNFPRFNRNLNTFGPPAEQRDVRIARQTIYHDTIRPTHILLPVIPGAEPNDRQKRDDQ
ncbi:CocE/NonD family hydrolase [Paenibacillus hemerocallicola]|uniref:CocE/NonD family hydrolase n=1 Tax=Paenibacillus hemerocallicola TaxID=1172614 RepID=A0A5C4SYM5_9BACL|nr:CocE/NonD family hydrolase [Paenibacillus hemerocallicola]TNJ61613.1 CocE/NonD family hydrolase [Paenibacillus hemerocallicola]